MCEYDRQAIYECIYKLRYDMDCIGEEEYTLENDVTWLEDMPDKELINVLIELLEPYME